MTPEFRLLVACAAWPRGQARDDGVVAAAAHPGLDWAVFTQTVARHRMSALALDGLTCAGVASPKDLAERAGGDVRRTLGLAAEAVRITNLFAAENIACAVVKGPVLSLLLYGAPALRQCKDLDVLVDPGNAPRAVAVLERQGFVWTDRWYGEPPAGWERLWMRMQHDHVLARRADQLIIELHHRLSRNDQLFAAPGLALATRKVSVGGGVLTTFEDEELFPYMCVHGSAHLWFRLKWLADVAAFLAGRSPDDIARLYGAAQKRRAGRAAGLALRLCQTLWGVVLPADLAQALAADRRLERLEGAALRALEGPPPLDSRRSWLEVERAQFALAESWAARWNHLVWLGFDIELMKAAPLPRPLQFVYFVSKPFSAVLRRLGIGRKPATAGI